MGEGWKVGSRHCVAPWRERVWERESCTVPTGIWSARAKSKMSHSKGRQPSTQQQNHQTFNDLGNYPQWARLMASRGRHCSLGYTSLFPTLTCKTNVYRCFYTNPPIRRSTRTKKDTCSEKQVKDPENANWVPLALPLSFCTVHEFRTCRV